IINQSPISTLVPTRRSSDLIWNIAGATNIGSVNCPQSENVILSNTTLYTSVINGKGSGITISGDVTLGKVRIEGSNIAIGDNLRSEEHTSELQSREKLVCRL